MELTRTTDYLFNSLNIEESRINHLRDLSIKKIKHDIYHKQFNSIKLNNVFFNFITSASKEEEVIPMAFEAVRFLGNTVLNRMANLIFFYDAINEETKLKVEENSSEVYIRVNQSNLEDSLEAFLNFKPLDVLRIDVNYNKILDSILYEFIGRGLDSTIEPKFIFDKFFSEVKYDTLEELSLISFRFAKFFTALISQ